jgi:hypothetical protein
VEEKKMKKLISIMAACLLVFGFAGMASADPCAQCETDPGNIDRGCEGVQDSCYPFDYEDFGRCERGYDSYCQSAGKTDIHRAIFELCDCYPDLEIGDTVYVSMEILVDKGAGPVAGENGVYWAQDVDSTIPVQAFRTQADVCAAEYCTPKDEFVGIYDYLLADGTEGTPYEGSICAVEPENRVVKIQPDVDAQNDAGMGDGYYGYTLTDAGKATLWIDIPWMRVDPTAIQKGWKVYVKICVDKELSTICDSAECCCLIYIGELCCDDVVKESGLIFPYFTAADSGWWSGIAITNVSSADGAVMLTLYEQDGNVFQTSEAITVPANSMVVYNQAMLYGLSWDVVKGSLATAGKSRFYVEATADVSIMGFGMMAKTSTGESMGYLAVPK